MNQVFVETSFSSCKCSSLIVLPDYSSYENRFNIECKNSQEQTFLDDQNIPDRSFLEAVSFVVVNVIEQLIDLILIYFYKIYCL